MFIFRVWGQKITYYTRDNTPNPSNDSQLLSQQQMLADKPVKGGDREEAGQDTDYSVNRQLRLPVTSPPFLPSLQTPGICKTQAHGDH